MQTYTKPYTFERLPAPQADPAAWSAHLSRRWGGEGNWSQPPFKTAAEARALVGAHMPELLPDFDALLPLCGDAPGAAQGLAMYNQRPFWMGCSESIARREGRTTLIRNYDLGVDEFSGCFRCETLPDGGWILGSAEAGWGYLDGINHRGLAISLTFGGRFVVGDGFTLLLVNRWLLQTCATVDEALERLQVVPHRLSQNLLLVDRTGAHALACLNPDRPAEIRRGALACTNHQGQPENPQHARFTRTVERLAYMEQQDGALTIADFLRPPLYNQLYREHFGTLYTVEYDPAGLTARYAWPDRELSLTPESPETAFTVTLTQGEL